MLYGGTVRAASPPQEAAVGGPQVSVRDSDGLLEARSNRSRRRTNGVLARLGHEADRRSCFVSRPSWVPRCFDSDAWPSPTLVKSRCPESVASIVPTRMGSAVM